MLAPRETLWSSHDEVIEAAVAALELKADDTLGDYGCGDGRVLQYAAKTVGCHGVGYEINEERAKEASDAVATAGLSHLVTIHADNALNADFDVPSAVFCFLIKRGLRIMLPRLNDAAKRRGGLRVVTVLYKFPPHVKPDRVQWVTVTEDLKFPLFVYNLPEKGAATKVKAKAAAEDGKAEEPIAAAGETAVEGGDAGAGAGAGGGGGGGGEEEESDADPVVGWRAGAEMSTETTDGIPFKVIWWNTSLEFNLTSSTTLIDAIRAYFDPAPAPSDMISIRKLDDALDNPPVLVTGPMTAGIDAVPESGAVYLMRTATMWADAHAYNDKGTSVPRPDVSMDPAHIVPILMGGAMPPSTHP